MCAHDRYLRCGEKRDDKKLRFYSMNFENLGVLESSVEGLKPEKEADWTNYPKGVMWAFGEKGMKVESGMDLVLFGNIPNGSGLSSSASVEVLTGFILRDMFGFDVTNQDLALIGQYSGEQVQRRQLRYYGSVRHCDGQGRTCDFPGYGDLKV